MQYFVFFGLAYAITIITNEIDINFMGEVNESVPYKGRNQTMAEFIRKDYTGRICQKTR